MSVTNDIIGQLRRRYKPDKINVLFVAESPPESTDDEVRFFYNPKQERFDNMYRSVMSAVFPCFEYRPGEKDKWLCKFKAHGYYMIDATDTPINRLPEKKRNHVLESSLKEKMSEIAKLVTTCTPILLVKKNEFFVFSGPLRDAGYNVIHDSFLPFPAFGYQKKFIQACSSYLQNHKRRAQ